MSIWTRTERSPSTRPQPAPSSRWVKLERMPRVGTNCCCPPSSRSTPKNRSTGWCDLASTRPRIDFASTGHGQTGGEKGPLCVDFYDGYAMDVRVAPLCALSRNPRAETLAQQSPGLHFLPLIDFPLSYEIQESICRKRSTNERGRPGFRMNFPAFPLTATDWAEQF